MLLNDRGQTKGKLMFRMKKKIFSLFDRRRKKLGV